METGGPSEHKAYALEVLDTPWLRLHVETHLILGPIARHVPFAWIMFAILLFLFIGYISYPNLGIVPYMGAVPIGILMLFLPVMLRKWPRYHQAALGWIAVKCAGGFIAFLFMVPLSLVSLVQRRGDALLTFLLGFVWFPWIEFLPKVTPHQKWVTAGRIVLTIPLAIWGIKGGYWS